MMRAIQEKLLFLYKFTRAPKQIGSVTPSSMFLAKKMIEQLDWSAAGNVAELGSGTGAITKFFDTARYPQTNIMLFEQDAFLREQLERRFPDYPCYADACKIDQALRKEGIEHLDCIFSGLPFFNFPQRLRDQLLAQIFLSLKPGGLFVAFQYSQQMRKQLEQQFDILHVHYVPLNIPPAFVYVCRKRA